MIRASSLASDSSSLAARIDAALPQTQCTRCGYPDCAAYAQAVASDRAGINQCPPGGDEGMQRLAALTDRPALPLNPINGNEGPRAVAVIDEDWCIGCTLCISACPTDAIVGANKLMHTVSMAHCTGCELCLPACPVDCIQMETVDAQLTGWSAWSTSQATHAKARYESRKTRLASTHDAGLKTAQSSSPATKKSALSAALSRARERLGK